ncbi:MAG: hypothetical protein EZS28_003707 [Streblomastix strix]|uniref:Uncharacterized protein n=1 Tax=Streblomastix strix TaxID=222440 RepID=A0A5J4X0E7_9EUKA|nr:MAG: hypothetical protein EZS28_003707 [Streblomastix strix]
MIRKRDDKATVTNQNSMKLQKQFQQEREHHAKFESLEEVKIAQDITATLSGIFNHDTKDTNIFVFQLQPIQRQKLFDEIAWYEANVMFPVPSAEATLPEERGLLASNDFNLVSKLCKICEAFLFTVGNTQRQGESRQREVQVVAEAQDVLSKTTREKFKRRNLQRQRNVPFQGKGRYGRQNNRFQKKVYNYSNSILSQLSSFSQRNRIFNPVIKRNTKTYILNFSYLMCLIGQSNKFLEQAKVRIDITSTVTNSQNSNEQSGFASQDHGSLALKDQPRTSDDLGSQCQEGQSYDIAAGYQQAQRCRPVSQLTFELTDESQIKRQSSEVDDIILIPANQHQKGGSNQLTNFGVGKHRTEFWSLGSKLEPRSVKIRQNQITELPSGSISYQQYTSLASFRQSIPIRGRLIHFIRVWQQIGADKLIQRGIKAYWIHAECPKILRKNKQKIIQTRSEDSLGALDQLIDQELQEQIVEKVAFKDLAWLILVLQYPNAILGNGYAKRNLVTQLLDEKDRSTIRHSSYPGGSRVQTFPGILTQESVLSKQRDVLWDETYTINIPQDVNTCYESNQTVVGRQRRIRDQKVQFSADSLRIRLKDLGKQILHLTNLRNRIPRMSYQFKTQSDNDVKLQKIEDVESNQKMEKNNQAKDFSQSYIPSKFHWPIEFPQALNQERGSSHEKLNKTKQRAAIIRGWNINKYLSKIKLSEVFWWKSKIEQNKLIRANLQQPQDILSTDASQDSWGATLKINSNMQEIWFQGDLNNHWRLTSSNQREKAAVHCGLFHSAPFLRQQQIQSLKVETDNRSTEYAIPDSHYVLATSGDYSFKEEILPEVLAMLRIRPSIDIFSNRCNRKFRSTISTPTYPSDTTNSKHTKGREGISIDDPSILAFSTVLACTDEDGIKIDNPRRKRRRPSSRKHDEKVTEASATRKIDDCLIRGFTITSVQSVINGWHEARRRYRQRLRQFDEYWYNLTKRREDLLNVEDPGLMIANYISQLEAGEATNASQAHSRSASSTLFQLQGFKKEKINGVALQQIMKKNHKLE